MATRHRSFTFSEDDTAGIVDEMASFAEGADGRRWLNIEPDVDEREVHTGSVLWKAFSSRGPVIPKLTWFPAHEHRGKPQLTQLGISHAAGSDAVERLVSQGIRAPASWQLVQDHQKRGVLFALDDATEPDDVVAFGLPAMRLLSPFGFERYFIATFSQQ